MNLYNYIEEVYSELIHTSDFNKDSFNIIKANSFEKLINDDKQCLNLIFSIIKGVIVTFVYLGLVFVLALTKGEAQFVKNTIKGFTAKLSKKSEK